MSLYNYLVKSDVSSVEIRLEFDHEQVKQLYNLLQEWGYKKYHLYLQNHLEDILKYISLPPSRRKAKKWVNRPDSLVFRFAALQVSSVTSEFLLQVVDADNVLDSGSYRQFHSIFARAVGNLLVSWKIYEFPFEGFDNPFFSN